MARTAEQWASIIPFSMWTGRDGWNYPERLGPDGGDYRWGAKEEGVEVQWYDDAVRQWIGVTVVANERAAIGYISERRAR